MLSLSTAFNYDRCRSWKKILKDTRQLGFASLELNVEIPETWMSDIERSVQSGEITISSLHNYSPRLDPLPPHRTIYSGYHLTSDDPEERALAVRFSLRTIEWAGRLGARAVVLHAGEVPTEPSGREFSKYIQQFGREGKLYGQYETALFSDRKKKAQKYVDVLKRSLDEIIPQAEANSVRLGLENRFHPHEIPNIDETRKLLDCYAGSPLGYWHDTGHAEVFVRQGWVPKHLDFFETLGKDLVGMHLHDLHGLADHYAPGSGDLDFAPFAPYVRSEVILVVEAHKQSTPQEVKEGIEYLKETGIFREN